MKRAWRALRNKAVSHTVSAVASIAPEGPAWALSRHLSLIPKRQLLSEALTGSSIESLTVRGRQGVFVGSAADASIIQKYAIDKVWSPNAVSIVLDFFKSSRNGTYFDIGGNIGLTVVPVAAAGINVVTFEPVPKNFEYLQQNIAANGVADRVIANNVALMDKPGEIVFELSPTNHGDHRARVNDEVSLMRENEWATTVVTAKRLDDFLPLAKPPLAIKMDTQGAEPFVISGGQKVFDMAELVLSEFSPYNMNRMRADSAPFIDYFSKFPDVSVFEAEKDEAMVKMSGSKLAAYLTDYERTYRQTTAGRYLNLIARR